MSFNEAVISDLLNTIIVICKDYRRVLTIAQMHAALEEEEQRLESAVAKYCSESEDGHV